MTRLRKIITEPVLFFILLFILVFLGDGKQTVVDIIAAAGILCLFVVRIELGGTIHPRRSPITVTWALLLAYLAIHTFFSPSVGYSISTAIRCVIAYLVFIFFSSQGAGFDIRVYTRLLVWFVGLCIGASALVTIFWRVGASLPGMNLLYPAYGHNHIADLIIFIFPLAVGRFIDKRDRVNTLLLLFLFAGLAFSFARGVIIVALVYLAYRLLLSLQNRKMVKTAVGLIILCIGIMAVFYLGPNIFSKEVSQNSILKRELIKSSAVESRVNYWREALFGFKNQPLFGAGPGTFYLISKRYQVSPNSYSWFAHSYPLQTLAELGLVGLIIIVMLFYYSLSLVVLAKNARSPITSALVDGVVLTLFYSFFEFNMDFIVVFLLVWATLGIVYKEVVLINIPNMQKEILGRGTIILLVLLGGYYLLFVSASIAALSPGGIRYAMFLEPYNTTRVIDYLSVHGNKVLPMWPDQTIIRFFHSGDAEVLMPLAPLADSPDLSKQYYREAIGVDKQNVNNLSLYIQFLLAHRDTQSIGGILDIESGRFLPSQSRNTLHAVHFSNNQLKSLYSSQLFSDVGTPGTVNEYLSKTYYFLGLLVLNDNPELTRSLWTLARDLTPTYGYFHVELASLEYRIFRDQKQTNMVLINCQKYYFASNQCKRTNIKFMSPGSQYENIKTIPTIR